MVWTVLGLIALIGIVWMLVRASTQPSRPSVARAPASDRQPAASRSRNDSSTLDRVTLQRWKAQATDLWLKSAKNTLLSNREKYTSATIDTTGAIEMVDPELDANDADFLARVEANLITLLDDAEVEEAALEIVAEVRKGKHGLDKASMSEFEQFVFSYQRVLFGIMEATAAELTERKLREPGHD